MLDTAGVLIEILRYGLGVDGDLHKDGGELFWDVIRGEAVFVLGTSLPFFFFFFFLPGPAPLFSPSVLFPCTLFLGGEEQIAVSLYRLQFLFFFKLH